ncbi:tape measure protein [Marinilactibacillus psychrotolerans]|uniref:tape measure protein n=1 Tax=Marinilactibacillus psychrotolerans TaxID=191770 RepID=UPI00388B40EA
MADGTIQIDVILDDGSVKKGIANLDGLSNSGKKAGTSIGSMVKAMGLVKIASSAFNVLKNSLDSAISRFDTMQKFPKVMKALGFSAEDSEKSITKLSDGIEGLPTKLDDVVSSTQQMTSITGDLDKSTDTVLALNNAFLASGSSADDASRGTQQYMQMLSSGTVDLESWKTLQETMPLALQKTAEAMGFVGKSAQRDLYAALKDGTVTFEDFQDQLIDLGTGTGDLAGLAKENSLGIATSFGNLRNAVAKNVANMITKFDEITQKLTGKTIAENIDSLKVIINNSFKSMTDSMDQIIPIIESLSETFEKMKPVIEPLIPFILGLVTGFITFKVIVGIITSVKNAILGLKLAFEAMKLVMIANPFALIVAAIAALAVGFIYLWKTNEKFRDKVIEIWNAIMEFLGPIIESIKTILMDTWNSILEWWNENQDSIMNKLVDTWNAMVEFLTPIVQAVVDFVMSVFATLLEWWNENQAQIKDTVSVTWEAIKSIFSNVIDLIVAIVEKALSIIQDLWATWGPTITAIVQGAWALIKNTFQGTLNNILSIVKFVINQVKTTIDTVMKIIQGITDAVLSAIEGDWDGVMDAIMGIVGAFADYIGETFGNLMDLAGDLVSNGVDAISGFFDDLWDIDLSAAGKAIIDGFLGGLKSAYEGVKDFVGGIAGWIADHKGPLTYDARLLIPAGNAIMGGLDESLQNRFKNVQRNIRSMADQMKIGFETGAESNFSRALPVTTAEQALGRNISGNSYSTNNQTVNNYSSNGSDTETIQLLKQIRDKTNDIILDGTSMVKKLGTKIDENQGTRTAYAEWGLELNG